MRGLGRSFLSITCLSGAFAACQSPTGGFSSVSGTVAALSLSGGWDNLGGVLVVYDSASAVGGGRLAGYGALGPCSRAIDFNFSPITGVYRHDGTAVPRDSLTIGRAVTVEWTGGLLLSCPGQTTAEAIILAPAS